MDYLTERCGVREEDITIVIANGTHIGGDEQELRTLVTDAVYDRVKVKNHDCEAKDLVYLGTTPHGTPVSIDRTAAEADLVVCLGAVTHHVMAGFGGGRKSILPGISGRETIFHNHAFSLDAAQLRSNPAIGNGVLKGQPAARGYVRGGGAGDKSLHRQPRDERPDAACRHSLRSLPHLVGGGLPHGGPHLIRWTCRKRRT